jgi:hypothetical protein
VHLIGALQVGTLARKGHLNARGAPGDEVDQLALADALQGLVHLGGVHRPLDDVKDGDVAARARARRHHDILLLGQSGTNANEHNEGCHSNTRE